MSALDIAVIVGSNRRESINRTLAKALVRLAPETLNCRFVQIDDLPMYNGDFGPDAHESVRSFRAEVARADGVLVVTPEHNRSIPAVLKSAIDWGSKPMDQNIWRNKPCAISGTSPGAIGTAVGQQHLRQILAVLGGIVVGGEAYLQFKPELFDADGGVTHDGTRNFLRDYMTRFAELAVKLAAH